MLQNAYLLAKIGADTAENISGDGGINKKDVTKLNGWERWDMITTCLHIQSYTLSIASLSLGYFLESPRTKAKERPGGEKLGKERAPRRRGQCSAEILYGYREKDRWHQKCQSAFGNRSKHVNRHLAKEAYFFKWKCVCDAVKVIAFRRGFRMYNPKCIATLLKKWKELRTILKQLGKAGLSFLVDIYWSSVSEAMRKES